MEQACLKNNPANLTQRQQQHPAGPHPSHLQSWHRLLPVGLPSSKCCCCCCVPLLLLFARKAKLVYTCHVHAVDPALVQVDEEDQVISAQQHNTQAGARGETGENEWWGCLAHRLVERTQFALINHRDNKRTCAPEHADAVEQGHLDDKGKQVIDDCVEELVGHLAPRQVGHALKLVVQVQLPAQR